LKAASRTYLKPSIQDGDPQAESIFLLYQTGQDNQGIFPKRWPCQAISGKMAITKATSVFVYHIIQKMYNMFVIILCNGISAAYHEITKGNAAS